MFYDGSVVIILTMCECLLLRCQIFAVIATRNMILADVNLKRFDDTLDKSELRLLYCQSRYSSVYIRLVC